MPVTTGSVVTADGYPADQAQNAPILGPFATLATVQFTIANALVACQVAKKKNADNSLHWDPFETVFAPGQGGYSGKVYGLKMRSYVAGTPATVILTGYYVDDPIPFLVTQAPEGEIIGGRFIPFAQQLAINQAQLGNTIGTNEATTETITIENQDVLAGDGILVAAMAPSVPAVAAPAGYPIACTDSQGNVYTLLETHKWEANPPNVNEGAAQAMFWCPSATKGLVAGTDTITVTWSHQVYDRIVVPWLIRHAAGQDTPTDLASTPDHDATSYAAGQVTLQSPAFTALRYNAYMFATIAAAKAGGLGGFGSVAGYNGYLQVDFMAFAGSQQSYLLNQQTYGADALTINPSGGGNPYEVDLGTLPPGAVAAFNGIGQTFSTGANAYKGITVRLVT